MQRRCARRHFYENACLHKIRPDRRNDRAIDRNRRETTRNPHYKDDGIQEGRTVCRSVDGTDA